MKKIFLLMMMLSISMPVFAVCSIKGGGMCSASAPSNSSLNIPSMEQKLSPNNLQTMQAPVQSPAQTNTMNNVPAGQDTNIHGKSAPLNYDASCQLGVCLPNSSTAPAPKAGSSE